MMLWQLQKYNHMMAHYFEEKGPTVFEPEPLLYRPKKVQPITPKQKTYLESLLLKHPFPLEKQNHRTDKKRSF